MKLNNATSHEIIISMPHPEFEILRGLVEHAAETDHTLIFTYPELLAGFRAAKGLIELAHAEGYLHEECPY
jgi:hypothetical protein